MLLFVVKHFCSCFKFVSFSCFFVVVCFMFFGVLFVSCGISRAFKLRDLQSVQTAGSPERLNCGISRAFKLRDLQSVQTAGSPERSNCGISRAFKLRDLQSVIKKSKIMLRILHIVLHAMSCGCCLYPCIFVVHYTNIST